VTSFSSSDLSQIRGAVLRDSVEGLSNSPLSASGLASTSTSTSPSSPLKTKTRMRKTATVAHQLNALRELREQWNTKLKQENHSAEDRYQVLELRDKILRIRKCIIFSMVTAKKIRHLQNVVPYT
jgi:hypothetical protein